MCFSAYTSLSRAAEAIEQKSTDAFMWLMDASTHFQNLQEYDNAIMALIKGIEFGIKIELKGKSYKFYCNARAIYEDAKNQEDPTVENPVIKQSLLNAGNKLIEAMKKKPQESILADMQAELKASILGGISLRKAEKRDEQGIVVVDGRQLYEKKAKEYREGAETYFDSGIIGNAITFVCLAALAELMLGRAKAGITYLKRVIADSGLNEKFQDNIVFKWTKLLLRAHVENDVEAIDQARKLYYEIPWSFKDDKEFARRVMDAIFNRVTSQS